MSVKQDINIKLKFLAELTGQALRLETWSPGDGWTRYSVVDDDTGRGFFGSYRVFKLHEMDAALTGAIKGFEAAKHRK